MALLKTNNVGSLKLGIVGRLQGCCLIALMLAPLLATCQKQTNNWLFGYNAGLNFNTSPPSNITGGQTHVREGVASISDKETGALLFYSDGTRAWNANHQMMPNGDGLLGDYSSTQSALIIPHPGNDDQYFLFTDDYHAGFYGYRYSIVDMSLDGGLGDIVPGTKNTLLYIGFCEKMIAVQHCNGRDYWLITHEGGTNLFHVHLIAENGIEQELIFAKGWYSGDGWQDVGYLKASADGRKLANAIGPTSNFTDSRLEVFDFDPATGAIEGPTVELTGYFFAYGVEFSSDNNLLYVSELQSFNGNNQGKVIQYNLQVGNSANIAASAVTLKQDAAFAYGALQRASDNRIYVSKEFGYDVPFGYLDVIQSPNTPGTGCGYSTDAINLGAGGTLIGLPTFALHAGFPVVDFSFEVQNGCSNPSVVFELENGSSLDSVHWQFGDTFESTSLPADSIILHNYPNTGVYTVYLVTYSQCNIDTLTKTVSIDVTSSATTVSLSACPGAEANYNGTDIIAGNSMDFTYTNWLGCDSIVTVNVLTLPSSIDLINAGACPNDFFNYNGQNLAPGTTTLFTALNQWGCTDSTIVVVASYQNSSSTLNLVACPGETITYNNTPLAIGDVVPFTLSNWLGCDSVVTVSVMGGQTDTVALTLGACPGQSINYNGVELFADDAYTWIGTNQDGCDSVVLVSVYSFPSLDFGLLPTQSCWKTPNGSLLVTNIVGTTAPYQFSLDGLNYQLDSLFTELAPGEYTVSLLDQNDCIFEQISVVPAIDTISILANDVTINCGESVTLSPEVTSPLPLDWEWSFGDSVLSTTPQITANSFGNYTFTISNKCESRTETILVSAATGFLDDRLYVPNSFSPNDDGFNDCFRAYAPPDIDLVFFELKIFDRWGELLFETTEIDGCWDGIFRGRQMNPAVMVYWLEMTVQDCIGRQSTVFKKGDIALLR